MSEYKKFVEQKLYEASEYQSEVTREFKKTTKQDFNAIMKQVSANIKAWIDAYPKDKMGHMWGMNEGQFSKEVKEDSVFAFVSELNKAIRKGKISNPKF